jgi:hypothetical protein
MKTIPVTLWLALVISAGTIENASAQFGGNGGGGGSYGGGGYTSGGGRGSVVLLVTYPEVQKDLALSDRQQEQVSAITRRFNDYERKMFAEVSADVARGAQAMEQRHAAAREMLARTRQEIMRVLTLAQVKRLEQISLQDLGAEALFRPDVAKALNLSQGQQQKLTQISDQTEQQIAASLGVRTGPPPGFPPGPRGSARRDVSVGGTNAFAQASSGAGYSVQKGPGGIGAILRESERRMMEEVLTPQQQAKLKELQGTPCPLKPRYVSRAGGGGGGGGNYGGSGSRNQ